MQRLLGLFIVTLVWLGVAGDVLANQRLSLWSINPGTAFGKLTDQIVYDFSHDVSGYHLDSTHFDNNFYAFHLKTALESGAGPDIFHHWGGASIRTLIEERRVIALDDLNEQLTGLLHSHALDPVTFDGTIYGVPYGGLAAVVFWYRKDLFAKFGIHPPKTWEELIAVGETLKQHNIIPIALANRNKWPGSFFYMYLVDRIGGPRLFNDAYLRQNGRTFRDPVFVRAGELIQDLVWRQFFPEGFNRMRDEPGNWNSLIISGRAGMYLMGSWFFGVIKELPPELRDAFDFFVFPVVEGGQGNWHDLVGSPGQDYLSISAGSANPEAAKLFLRNYVCTEKYFRRLADLGFVPSVRNPATYLKDPLAAQVAYLFERAAHVQRYYDQILPAPHAEAHKLMVHLLFDLQMTPEQVASGHEALVGASDLPQPPD